MIRTGALISLPYDIAEKHTTNWTDSHRCLAELAHLIAFAFLLFPFASRDHPSRAAHEGEHTLVRGEREFIAGDDLHQLVKKAKREVQRGRLIKEREAARD